MNKKTLVSLLAIPVFSLATIFHLPNYSFGATTYNSFYQESKESKKIKAKTVAAGVIKFLLGNPKTADKMNPTEQLALGLIGDLLETQGQREHELDVAVAGRSQFITTDGRQGQFVKDESGNIYLVMEGVIHPISQELVSQARNLPISKIENATLPLYNLGGLENRFNANPKEDASREYKPQKGGEYLSDIAKKFDVPESNIFYWQTGLFTAPLRPISKKIKIWEKKKKVKTSLWIAKEKYKNEISTIFSYKWHQDLNGDGALGFDEFNQIRRTFYNDEDFNIMIDYQTEKGFKGNLELKILEDNTGKIMLDREVKIISNGPRIDGGHFPAGEFPVGVYLVHTNLKNYITSETVSSASERFEIVQRTTEKKIN